MESVSQTMMVVVPFISITIAVVGLMFNVAKATTAERMTVVSWIAKIIFIALMVMVITWFSIQMFRFATTPGPASRYEIVLFCLSFFNVLAYGNALADYLIRLAGRGRKLELERLREEVEKMKKENAVLQARQIAVEEINRTLQGLKEANNKS